MYARIDSLHFKHEEFVTEAKQLQLQGSKQTGSLPPATQEQMRKMSERLYVFGNVMGINKH